MATRHKQVMFVTALSGTTATLDKSRTWGPLPQPAPRAPVARVDYELGKIVITTTNAVSGADLFSCPGFILVTLDRLT